MQGETLTAFGRTWPLVRTPQIAVEIRHTSEVNSEIPIERQIAVLDYAYRRRFAGYSDAQIKVEQVDSLDLSPEDRAEHNRLMDEALNPR